MKCAVLALLGVLGTAHGAAAVEPERCENLASRRLVGYVVSATGTIWAQDLLCERELRPMVCGALLFEGERLETAGGARVGFVAQSLRVQMGAESAVILQLTQQGAPDLNVVRGRLRARGGPERAGGAPRLVTSEFEVSLRDNDTEVTVGPTTTICEESGALALRRPDGRTTTLEADQCRVAAPGQELAQDDELEQELTLEDSSNCVRDIGDAVDYFNPNDVAAAGGFSPGPPGNDGPPDISCVIDPSLCAVDPPEPPPVPPVPPTPPTPPLPGVVESSPVFRPPPGLPRR